MKMIALLLLRLVLIRQSQFWSSLRGPVNRFPPLLALLLLPALACFQQQAANSHRQEIDEWHQERLQRLDAEDGWLTLVALGWLAEGATTFGPDASNGLQLPIESPLSSLGSFHRLGDVVHLKAAASANLEAAGTPVDNLLLRSDDDGEPTLVRSGSVSFHLISRGERIGVRVRDSDSPTRRNFQGIQRYSTDLAWRFDARFEPAPEGTTIPVPNIIGEIFDEDSPGTVIFRHRAATHRLRALAGASGALFLVFGDETNGKETYGSGRFLYTPPPDADGRVVLDFNRAYNPPCVFTQWATCPLPPRGNNLPFPVRAGELSYTLEVAH